MGGVPPAIPDLFPGEGPLGGILTALAHTGADFNLVTACDMPELDADFLRLLLGEAETAGADALLPCGPDGRPEPLARCTTGGYGLRWKAFSPGECAKSRARWLPRTSAPAPFRVSEVFRFQNVNTPEEWDPYDS